MRAYVHESEGRPGIDAGTGWTQPVRITVFEGRGVRRHEGDRLWIIDGVISVGDETFDNMMPTDVTAHGGVKHVFSGAALDVIGRGLRVEATGQAVIVEEVPEEDGQAPLPAPRPSALRH